MSGPSYDLTGQYQENIDDTYSALCERRSFIDAFAQRTGQEPEVLWIEFQEASSLRSFVAKDPRKQNAHEKIAQAWISQIPGISDFQKLPSTGPDALYVHQGIVLRFSELPNNNNTVKSIDFTFKLKVGTNVRTYYAPHKHTQGPGGSQLNQHKDLLHFLTHASALTREMGRRFIALADGNFYTIPRGTSCFMEDLQKMCAATSFCQAMSCAELTTYLSQEMKEMLALQPHPPTPAQLATAAALALY